MPDESGQRVWSRVEVRCLYCGKIDHADARGSWRRLPHDWVAHGESEQVMCSAACVNKARDWAAAVETAWEKNGGLPR